MWVTLACAAEALQRRRVLKHPTAAAAICARIRRWRGAEFEQNSCRLAIANAWLPCVLV
jgi:hypothetical protein